jgi:hypothetical protein
MRGVGGGVGGPPLGSPLAGSPVTRNAEIDPPPPKMTQGGNDPANPPSSPSTASLSRVARCWHSNAYFSLFSLFFLLFFFDPPNRFVQIPRDLSIVSILLALLFSLFHKRRVRTAIARRCSLNGSQSGCSARVGVKVITDPWIRGSLLRALRSAALRSFSRNADRDGQHLSIRQCCLRFHHNESKQGNT